MRIDMILKPDDLFTLPPTGIDVEASGRTFAVELTKVLANEFPDARFNVWFNPIEVRSEEKVEVHWDDGEINPDNRDEAERGVLDRVDALAQVVRSNGDWIVRGVVVVTRTGESTMNYPWEIRLRRQSPSDPWQISTVRPY